MAWLPSSVDAEDWGRLQIVAGNVDVTFFRGAPTQVGEWSSTEPFGDSALTLRFPQITTYESIPFIRTHTGTLSFISPGSHVELFVVRPNGTTARLWAGVVVSFEDELSEDDYGLGVHAIGALYQADLGVKPPGFMVDAQDIGTAIASALNDYVSRDYATCAPVSTGIFTRKRGGWEPRLTGYVQDLLATATTDDGANQWTVSQRSGWLPVIELKNRTTVHATLVTGQPGVSLSLAADMTGIPNIIFGEGTDSEGCHWRNTKYPNLRTDDAPIFPGGSASSVFVAGGGKTGFYLFVLEMGKAYTMHSGDTYIAADVGNVRDAQFRAGILVDGIVGPQTWAAIFQTGSNGGDLNGAYFAPLVWDMGVVPLLYNAQGGITGTSPYYRPDTLRVEGYENFGEGISKADGMRSAVAEWVRTANNHGGWSGRLSLNVDPAERSRFELRAGMNVLLKSHRGADRMLHVSGASVSWADGTVSLTVDESARDLVTLASIRARNREASSDPARRSSTLRRKSRNTQDQFVVFDCESGAGQIPRHAIFGGLWTVLRIPAGQIGSIVRTTYNSDGVPFAVGIFGSEVTSNDLAAIVGDPLSSGTAWTDHGDLLDDRNLLIAWGTQDQPMGYYPGSKSDGGAVTGRFIDAASWSYESAYPPWLWVAEFSPNSTYLSGKLDAGVES